MLHLPIYQRYSVSVVLFHWILRLVVSARWVLVVDYREWRGFGVSIHLSSSCGAVATGALVVVRVESCCWG
jgi:cytochrome b561